jgi:lipoxygenase homology domain-containing protein 1
MDRFRIEAADLGKLFKIKVRHDNSSLLGNEWFLDRIEITEGSHKYIFLCERWLSKSKEDKKIERTLYEKVCKFVIIIIFGIDCKYCFV